MTRKYFKYAFGVDGDLTAVPNLVTGDGSVSYQQGFGPDYQADYPTDPDALPVPRTQSNQLYFDITQAIQQIQSDGFNLWISASDNGAVAFSYRLGAIVIYTDGQYYQSNKAANVDEPTAGAGAISWQLLPVIQQGVAPVICDYASTTNLTLANLQNIDGGTGVAGQVIGCFGQTTPSECGVYKMVDAGAWVRVPYYNSAANVLPGSIVPVRAGTQNGNKYFQLVTAGPIIVGTTALVFSSPAATVANNSITNAKLAQMAALTFKANNTNALANAADITVAQAQAMLGLNGGAYGRGISNLVITVNSNTAATITADQAALNNGSGGVFVGSAINLTVDITVSGAGGLDAGAEAANTWYSVWFIWNPTTLTLNTLLSTSATAPTLPAGYPYKLRVGWVRNNASSNLYLTLQKNNRARYITGTNPATKLLIGTGGGANSLTPFVPPTAYMLEGFYSWGGGGNNDFLYTNANSSSLFEYAHIEAASSMESWFDYFLENTNIYINANSIYATGWVDNL